MNNRTVHENHTFHPPIQLSSLWIAILLANLFRDIHEVLRPGFVEELATAGTVYGNQVTDSTLLWSSFALVALVAMVPLARVLPRLWNRRANYAAAAMMASGVLVTWPKDPDDLVFGASMIIGLGLIVAICVRWREEAPSPTESERTELVSGSV